MLRSDVAPYVVAALAGVVKGSEDEEEVVPEMSGWAAGSVAEAEEEILPEGLD